MTAQLITLEGKRRDLGLNLDAAIRLALEEEARLPTLLGLPIYKTRSWNMVSLRPPLQF